MLEGLPILSLITFIPLAGALMLMFMARISKEDAQEQLAKNAPRVALVISGVVFLLSLLLRGSGDFWRCLPLISLAHIGL